MAHYHTIFLSDIHLGNKFSQASTLLNFLKDTTSNNIILVGDIIDIWSLKRKWYWPQEHNDVVQKLLRKSRKGVNVHFIPGNHDEAFRSFTKISFGDISVSDELIYITLNNKKILCIHGDQFDILMKNMTWIMHIGDFFYERFIELNSFLSRIRRWMGLPYWSLSAWVKKEVKNAVSFISKYEEALIHAARKYEVDGVLCGHIHSAANRINSCGLHYLNCGDMVESCTCIVETMEGEFKILYLKTMGY